MHQTPPVTPHPAQPGLFATAFLLFGYAIENLLKGLIVQAGGNRTGHNLSELAKEAKVMNELDKDEQELLKRLTVHVRWAGRYPVALAKEREGIPPGSIMPYAMLHPKTDAALVEQLFARLESLYDASVPRIVHRKAGD